MGLKVEGAWVEPRGEFPPISQGLLSVLPTLWSPFRIVMNDLSAHPKKASVLTILSFSLPLLIAISHCSWVKAQDGVEPVEVFIEVSSVEAYPGDTAVVDVFIETQEPLGSLQLAINFDESRLQFIQAHRLLEIAAPGDVVNPAPPQGAAFNNENRLVGNQAEEGWVYLELDAHGITFEPGENTALIALEFWIPEDAPDGFANVEFSGVGAKTIDDEVVPLYINQVFSDADFVEGMPIPPENFVGGGVKIIGEVGFFMRGDANYDKKLDISDPIFTLSYLFAEGEKHPCEDSGDANDDGALDITDPIFALEKMYLTGGHFPAPHKWGRDPTSDRLGCKSGVSGF